VPLSVFIALRFLMPKAVSSRDTNMLVNFG